MAIPSLARGGAQRVVTTLANHWAGSGWEVSIVTLAPPGQPPAYPVDPQVNIVRLDAEGHSGTVSRAVAANIRRVRLLRAAIRRAAPDAVISFMLPTNVLVLLACAGLGVRVVVSERAHPPAVPGPPVWRLLARLLYHRAWRVVVQTDAAAEFFRGTIAARCRVIPNPVDGRCFTWRSSGDRGSPVMVAMGRLEIEKGFDLLIQAFAAAASGMPDWQLEIWGEGPERDRLSSSIVSLGLERRVSLMGPTEAPQDVFARAAAFVLSSRFEGYPNVLCEAMACGLPVIAFDCPSGPAEIVEHESTGLLVAAGDTAALSRAMLRVAGSPALREALGARAQSIRSRLTLERIADAWAEVLGAAAIPARAVEAQRAWR